VSDMRSGCAKKGKKRNEQGPVDSGQLTVRREVTGEWGGRKKKKSWKAKGTDIGCRGRASGGYSVWKGQPRTKQGSNYGLSCVKGNESKTDEVRSCVRKEKAAAGSSPDCEKQGRRGEIGA